MVRRHLSARLPLVAALALLVAEPARAQSPLPGGLPPPPGMTMPAYARHRFPQPVPVRHLVGAVVQQPVESQAREGSVRAVIREPDGTLAAVVHVGATFGIGGRDIAVPLDAMALLGEAVEIVGFTPAQLRHFPTVRRPTDGGATVLPADAIVRVGLAKPSH
jgi:hypothetical protein